MMNVESGFGASVPNRREFLQAATLGGGAAALGMAGLPKEASGAEPPKRNGKSHMTLSLAAYSFNRHLPRRGTRKEISQAKMTLEDFVRFCADLNLDGTEPTSYYFPKDVTQEDLLRLKGMAFRLGLDISGTAIGNDFCLPEGKARDEQLAMTRRWIDYAAVLGVPVIRIFAGRVPKGESEETAIQRCIAGINDSLEYAAEKGVFLALENHGGITSTPEQMLRIVKAVDSSDWFGVNFDSGNFRTADPYADLEKIAPYAVNAQIKVEIARKGQKKEPANLERIVNILREANYRGYVVLEYEAREEPTEAIPGYIKQLRALIS